MADQAPVVSTATAISPDSGEHWSVEGAWPVGDGIYRVPLPLPNDGLKAVNVYVIETEHGLVLIDGGWAIDAARDQLQRSVRAIGYAFADIREFLVTHMHRDHFTLASLLGAEHSAHVSLGRGEEPSLDLIHRGDPGMSGRSRGEAANVIGTGRASGRSRVSFRGALETAGAPGIADEWESRSRPTFDPLHWRYPDTWLDDDDQIEVGGRMLDAVHTPGHTPGHFVFADRSDQLLFAGDHILPTITPSIGFSLPVRPDPLGDYMASLTKVRALPDLRLLPAHGPVATSSHARIDELLAHHDERLEHCRAALGTSTLTAHDVARTLRWTRHEREFDSLDAFNRGLAAMETMAHLDVLAARGLCVAQRGAGAVWYAMPAES